MLKFLRSEEIKRLKEDRESVCFLSSTLDGFKREEDDLGLPIMKRESGSQTSENEAGDEEG
jgi:hypothetical protein